MSKFESFYKFAHKHPFITSSIIASVIGFAKCTINGIVDIVSILKTGKPASSYGVVESVTSSEESEGSEGCTDVEKSDSEE